MVVMSRHKTESSRTVNPMTRRSFFTAVDRQSFFVVEAMMRVPNPAENECWRIVYRMHQSSMHQP